VGRYLSLPILFIAAIVQSTVVPEIRIGSGGPDLILMLVLSWTLLADIEEGLYWAIVGGILQDLINGVPTGTSALALVVVAFVVNMSLGQIGRTNLIVPPLVAVVGTALYQLVLAALLAVVGHPVPIGYSLTHVTLPTGLFNIILMLPIFRLMGAVFVASRPRRVTL
jgi:rod shape-determining protein MreD